MSIAVVRQIDMASTNAVPGRIEDVPVALLNRDRELLLGPGFQLAHLGLLVLGQIEQALGLLQLPEGQTLGRPAPHLLLAGLVGDDEHQIVAQRSQGGALGALARTDSAR